MEKNLARDERLVLLLYIINQRSFVTTLVNSELINLVCVSGIESFLPCKFRRRLRLLQCTTSLVFYILHHIHSLSLSLSFSLAFAIFLSFMYCPLGLFTYYIGLQLYTRICTHLCIFNVFNSHSFSFLVSVIYNKLVLTFSFLSSSPLSSSPSSSSL